MEPSTQLVLATAFFHFYHMDNANAAIHMQPVRYSPLTFRLAEELADMGAYDPINYPTSPLSQVMGDRGRYPEDTGR